MTTLREKAGMAGWKTWTGIGGVVLTQIAITYFGMDMETLNTQADKILELIRAAFGAFALLGLGSKADRAIKAAGGK